ncbi:hypothetical protein [Almyronema epifaneia]|uniref:HTTM domain-containing protein n=1 Tax=Almyronema epifaneia S1 TaxID=2991925 RepID=A0ABW6IB32_9CYAN
MTFAKAVSSSIDRWFTQPEPNAAGRMGLFRIFYGLFYLWHLSNQYAVSLSNLPSEHFIHPVLLIALLPSAPSVWFCQVLECGLVAALVLLVLGLRIRLMTALVLVLGGILEAYYIATDGEHSTILIAFYIPFFMGLNNDWGHTYALDTLIKQRSLKPSVAPSESHWRYFLSARSVLVILSLLFLSSALFKFTFGGVWLTYPDLMANLVLQKNIAAALQELPLNPIAPWIAQTPWVYHSLRFSTLLCEGLFFLSLLGRQLRLFFVSLALLFHAVNALFLTVTFTPVLIVYALFIDWQAAVNRLQLKFKGQPAFSTSWLVGSAIAIAIGLGLLWSLYPQSRTVFNFNGLLNWRSIWYPVVPFALIGLGLSIKPLSRPPRRQLP